MQHMQDKLKGDMEDTQEGVQECGSEYLQEKLARGT